MEQPQLTGLRDRVLAALVDPIVAKARGYTPAVLVAVHDPLVLMEWPGEAKGLVLLDAAQIGKDELRGHLDRVIGAHDTGLLFLAVVGGDESLHELLLAADKEARDPGRLGVYHVDGNGKSQRLVGRKLPELEQAIRKLPETKTLSPQDLATIIAHGQRDRQEAVDFVRRVSHRVPHLTLALIALCFLLFAITSAGDDRSRRLYTLFANSETGLLAGEWWRLITYAFLHSQRSAVHIVVNMLSLFSLGGFLEPILGKRRLGLLYFVTAFMGGLASALVGHHSSVGASGAVWGLLGATMGLLHGQQGFFPGLIARGMRRRLGVALVANIALSFLPGIDFACHLGGGLAGYVLGRLGILGKRPYAKPIASV